jgi:hypothetical protein
MPKTLKWGQEYSVLLDVGAIADAFTLDSSTLDGTDVLDGSTDFVDATEYVLSVAIQRGRTNQPTSSHLALVACWLTTVHQADCSTQRTPHQPTIKATSTWRRDAQSRSLPAQPNCSSAQSPTSTSPTNCPNLSFASIVSADGLYELSRTAITAFEPSSQLTSARVSAILDRPEVNFSTALRDISTGVATCGTVAYTDNTNTLGVASGRDR